MPNKQLENKVFLCPMEIVNYIKTVLNGIGDKEIKGKKRAKDIVNDRRFTYSKMKRFKNFFDNFNGDKKSLEYHIIGGDMMCDWICGTLGVNRKVIDDIKRTRMNAGEENQFKQSHNKDRANSNPTGVNIPKLHRSKVSHQIFNNNAVYEQEQLNRMNFLFEYLKK
jgi:hypothetical protein